MFLSFCGKSPRNEGAAFVAPNATVQGDVILKPGSTVWYGAVLRGDDGTLTLGENSNVQDNAVLHCDVVFKTIHSKKLLAEQDEEKQIQNLSQTMAELNIIHPFREGNGRSTRELIRCMALEYGLHINWGNTDRETLINAAIAAVDDDMAFCDVLRQCVETEN